MERHERLLFHFSEAKKNMMASHGGAGGNVGGVAVRVVGEVEGGDGRRGANTGTKTTKKCPICRELFLTQYGLTKHKKQNNHYDPNEKRGRKKKQN